MFLNFLHCSRNVTMSSTSKKEPYRFTPRQCLSTTASVIDIRVSPASHWAVLGRSNAVLIVIDTQSFQSVRTFRACKDPKATLERLCLDARGALVVTACSDRSINLLSVHHGLRLACLKGHATPVSGLVLTSDMRHVISSSRDGCIFLWEIHRCARRQANSLLKLGVRRAKFEVKKAPNVILSSKSSVELSNKPEISQTPSTASMPKSHSSMDVSG